MKVLSNLLEESKHVFLEFVEFFTSRMGIVGTFFNAVHIRRLKPEEVQELVTLSNIRQRTHKIAFGNFAGYAEIKRHGSGNKLILTVVYRFTEKVSSFVKTTKSDGKTISRRISMDVYHIFTVRIDLEHMLYVFSYGVYNPSISRFDPYRPIKDIYQLLDIYGIIEYERSMMGFLYVAREHIDDLFNIIGGILVV